MKLRETAFRQVDRKARVCVQPLPNFHRAVEDQTTDFKEVILGLTAGANILGPDPVITAYASAALRVEAIDVCLNGQSVPRPPIPA